MFLCSLTYFIASIKMRLWTGKFAHLLASVPSPTTGNLWASGWLNSAGHSYSSSIWQPGIDPSRTSKAALAVYGFQPILQYSRVGLTKVLFLFRKPFAAVCSMWLFQIMSAIVTPRYLVFLFLLHGFGCGGCTGIYGLSSSWLFCWHMIYQDGTHHPDSLPPH